MAIPAYAFSASFMADVDRIEKYFDEKLLNSKLSDNHKLVSIDVPTFYNTKYFVALKERYLKVGWKSVSENYEREGCWLNFQLP